MQIPVSVSVLDRPAFDRTQLCLFTCAINLWHQKLVTADITAVFVNSQHDIKRPGQDFDKRSRSLARFMRTAQFVFVSSCARSSWNISDASPYTLEMWANAQRDGRPTEYRWRPLFNATKFGWHTLLQCRAVTLPRHETRWNYLECPKLTKWSQPLVGRSSPYCKDMWRRYCCLTSIFSDCRYEA